VAVGLSLHRFRRVALCALAGVRLRRGGARALRRRCKEAVVAAEAAAAAAAAEAADKGLDNWVDMQRLSGAVAAARELQMHLLEDVAHFGLGGLGLGARPTAGAVVSVPVEGAAAQAMRGTTRAGAVTASSSLPPSSSSSSSSSSSASAAATAAAAAAAAVAGGSAAEGTGWAGVARRLVRRAQAAGSCCCGSGGTRRELTRLQARRAAARRRRLAEPPWALAAEAEAEAQMFEGAKVRGALRDAFVCRLFLTDRGRERHSPVLGYTPPPPVGETINSPLARSCCSPWHPLLHLLLHALLHPEGTRPGVCLTCVCFAVISRVFAFILVGVGYVVFRARAWVVRTAGTFAAAARAAEAAEVASARGGSVRSGAGGGAGSGGYGGEAGGGRRGGGVGRMVGEWESSPESR
jgi:hypothetical protein